MTSLASEVRVRERGPDWSDGLRAVLGLIRLELEERESSSSHITLSLGQGALQYNSDSVVR